MHSIRRIVLCDGVAEGEFHKLNITGYHTADTIGVNELPYLLKKTILIEAEIDALCLPKTVTVRVSHYLPGGIAIFDDANLLPVKVDLPEIVPAGRFPLVLPISFIRRLDAYTELTVTVALDTETATRSFKIIKTDAPNYWVSAQEPPQSKILKSDDSPLAPIIAMASRELILIDQYLTPDFLATLLASVHPNAAVEVLARDSHKMRVEYSKWSQKLTALCPQLEVRLNNTFHDRFVIANGTQCYHFGYSLASLPKTRISRVSQVVDKKEIVALKAFYSTEWAAARPVVQPVSPTRPSLVP